jgi:hypothetical protein
MRLRPILSDRWPQNGIEKGSFRTPMRARVIGSYPCFFRGHRNQKLKVV